MRLTLPLDKIKVNLPIISNRIWVWDKLDGDHMLNEDDKEVWCFCDENDKTNVIIKMKNIEFFMDKNNLLNSSRRSVKKT